MPSGWVGVNCSDRGTQARKGSSMTDEERSDAEPTGEESPYRSPEEMAAKVPKHEYPTMGRGDQESLSGRPSQDEDEIDGDTEEGGTPPGTSTRGA